jgi:uncharacterized protein YndB with AHSA1/START domain
MRHNAGVARFRRHGSQRERMASDRVVKTFSVDIGRPAPEVFAYLSDLTRHGEWSPTGLRVEPIAPGPVAVGGRYRSFGFNLGRQFENQLEITEFEPPKRFGFRAQTQIGSRLFRHTFVLTPTAAGVRVDRIIEEPKVGVIFGLLAWIVIPPRRQRKTLKLLKSRIETLG